MLYGLFPDYSNLKQSSHSQRLTPFLPSSYRIGSFSSTSRVPGFEWQFEHSGGFGRASLTNTALPVGLFGFISRLSNLP